MAEIRTTLIGVRHDGGGAYPRQTIYTEEPDALAHAEACDPGHVHPIYEYRVSGIANVFQSREAAERMADTQGR